MKMWNKSKRLSIRNSDNLDDDVFDNSLNTDTTDLEFLEDGIMPQRYANQAEIIGMKFNRWTVLSRIDPKTLTSSNKYSLFEVQCDCGVLNRLTCYVLTRGKSTMCKRCYVKDRKVNRLRFWR